MCIYIYTWCAMCFDECMGSSRSVFWPACRLSGGRPLRSSRRKYSTGAPCRILFVGRYGIRYLSRLRCVADALHHDMVVLHALYALYAAPVQSSPLNSAVPCQMTINALKWAPQLSRDSVVLCRTLSLQAVIIDRTKPGSRTEWYRTIAGGTTSVSFIFQGFSWVGPLLKGRVGSGWLGPTRGI